MISEIWSREKDLRPNMPLRLRRVQNISAGTSKTAYSSELVCCKVVLPLANIQNEDHADFLLNGWIKTLDPILSKHELLGYVERPPHIDTPEEFVRGIVTSETYIQKHKDAQPRKTVKE